MEAFRIRSCSSDESSSDEPFAGSRSQDYVIRDSAENGLPVHNKVPVVDGDLGRHSHVCLLSRGVT